MALTLETLRESLIDQLGLLEIDEMIPEASLNRSVNAGLRRMAREMDWPWLKVFTTLSITEGTDTYALPAGLVRITAVGVGSQILSALSPEAMIETFEEVGSPLFYVEEAGSIRLAPNPNANDTLRLVYVRPENVLVTDSDVVRAPDVYEDIIVTYAAIHQATRLKDKELLDSLERVRVQTLQSAKRDVLKTSHAPRLQVRDDV